jgi:hypothetical protein
MSSPLEDITIYNFAPSLQNSDFIKVANFIADFYHRNLNGYKPPKTGRICIHFGPNKEWQNPFYFGSICTYSQIFDNTKYLNSSKIDKYSYVLNSLHTAILELADAFGWEKARFTNSFNHIIDNNFKFEKMYPSKKSRDKKSTGQIILSKTEEKSIISVLITSKSYSKRIFLMEKQNWFWYDSIYKMAEKAKWIDKDSFGISKGKKHCYYSLSEDRIINDLHFSQDEI